jgi:hypothetical protein
MLPLDHLIVVAGPSCCGKSTFIDRLKNGETPDITSSLGIENLDEWIYRDAYYIDAALLDDINNSPSGKLVLHWTIPSPGIKLFLRDLSLLFAHDKKDRLRILQSANHLTVLTLYTSRNIFMKRVNARRMRIMSRRSSGMDGMLKYHVKMRHTRLMDRIYSDTDNLSSMYNRWFRLCASLNVDEMLLVKLEGYPTLSPADQWPMITDQWRRERIIS